MGCRLQPYVATSRRCPPCNPVACTQAATLCVQALAAWASGGRFCASDNLGTHLTERSTDFAMRTSDSWPTPSQPTIVRVSAPVPPGGI